MKNKILLFFPLALILSVSVFTACSSKETSQQNSVNQAGHEDPEGFWTCPMHPQIHQHEKGKCPICGMDLVHVESKESSKPSSENTTTEMDVNEISVTSQQLNLVGTAQYKVQRQDITFDIPVSGNMISSQEVILQIYEADLALVQNESEFSGSANTSPGQTLKGKIKKIDAMVDPTTRTLKIYGTLDQPLKTALDDGGFHGKITVLQKNQIAVPEDAVMHTGKRDLVYIFSDKTHVKPVSVVLGSKSADHYQILSGLDEDDVISTGPNFLLDSESKIRGGN
jgi:multidrug efflux pump subunit AcrA (membrane-fusion protein)